MIILKKHKTKGFSLIEVLTSVLVLAGFISILVQLSYGNTRRMKKVKQMEKAAYLLEFKMLELEEKFKMAKLPDQDKGEFENKKNYSWSYKTQALILPDPQMFLSLISFPENELNIKIAQTLTSVLSDSVTELKLTVHYKAKRGPEFHYSLVSYFINYEEAPDLIVNHIGRFFAGNPRTIMIAYKKNFIFFPSKVSGFKRYTEKGNDTSGDSYCFRPFCGYVCLYLQSCPTKSSSNQKN